MIVAAVVLVATLAITSAAVGVRRYVVIARLIKQKLPSLQESDFSRWSIHPISVLSAAAALISAIGVYSGQWYHGVYGTPPH